MTTGTHRRQDLVAPLLAIVFCSVVAALSSRPGWSYLLFPELSALSTTVLQNPWGAWGRRPWQLVVLPGLAAIAGLLISQHLHPVGLAVLLAVLAAKLLLLLFRSPLVPALSAAALPVILGIRSWDYPLQISLGLAAFTLLLLLFRHSRPRPDATPAPSATPARSAPPARGLLRWLTYLLPLLLAEHLSGLHTLLLPPLIVLSHEGLVPAGACPWQGRGWLLPLVFGTTAGFGLLMAHLLGGTPALATALAMAATWLLLRRLRLHLPSAFAMAVLPQLLSEPAARVLIGVLIGSSALAMLQRWLPGGALPAESGV